MTNFWSKLHDAFHEPSSLIYRRVQPLIWFLILFSILLFVLEFTVGDDTELGWVQYIDRIVLGIFAIEFLLRVGTFRPPRLDFFAFKPHEQIRIHITGRLIYCLQPLNLVDLLTVLALVPALRGLRALRLLRLIRTSKFFRYSQPFQGLLRALAENSLLFAFGASLLGGATIVGGISIYLVERTANKDINAISDGLWWAIVTLTTVGYGDVSPQTTLGRLVATVLMISGMFTLALFTAIVGHALLNSVLTIREEQFRMSTYVNHIIICGYDPGARMLLDEVIKELETDDREVVIFTGSDRPSDVPPRFNWIRGDPTKESEIDKIRLTHASALIIVGSRTNTPQQADAITLLTAFTVRSYLKQQPKTGQRKKPLHIIAEILDAENIEHARSAGVDEVIETTRLGFSLLAHALYMPGTASVMSQFASFEHFSLYIHNFQGDDISFHDLTAQYKSKHGAIIIGIRGTDTHKEMINPPDDMIISAHMQILYLSENPIASLTTETHQH